MGIRVLMLAGALWQAMLLILAEKNRRTMELRFRRLIGWLMAFYCVSAILLPITAKYSTFVSFLWLAAALFPAGFFLIVWLYPLLGRYPRADGTENILLLLGAPVLDGQAGEVLQLRIRSAADWLTAHPDCRAILSGGNPHGCTEAAVIEQSLCRSGVDPQRLIPESASTNTKENLLFSSGLLAQDGWEPTQPLVILTSDFHLFRLRRYVLTSPLRNVHYRTCRSPAGIGMLWAFREAAAMMQDLINRRFGKR